MKKLAGLILMLPLLLAAGALRITDSSRAGSNALRNAALEFSISCNTDIRIDRMPAHTLRHYTGALTDIRPAKSEFYF